MPGCSIHEKKRNLLAWPCSPAAVERSQRNMELQQCECRDPGEKKAYLRTGKMDAERAVWNLPVVLSMDRLFPRCSCSALHLLLGHDKCAPGQEPAQQQQQFSGRRLNSTKVLEVILDFSLRNPSCLPCRSLQKLQTPSLWQGPFLPATSQFAFSGPPTRHLCTYSTALNYYEIIIII